jgi:hypothetical protein
MNENNMNIYKLLIAVEDNEENIFFEQLHFDVSLIIGCLPIIIPDNEPEQIRVYIRGGGSFDVVQEEHILQYLKEKFIDVAFSNESFIKKNFDKK